MKDMNSNKRMMMLLMKPWGVVAMLFAIITTVALMVLLLAQNIFVQEIVDVNVRVFINAALLRMFAAPAVYFLIFRKLHADVIVLKQTAEQLGQRYQKLDELLQTRTQELEQARPRP